MFNRRLRLSRVNRLGLCSVFVSLWLASAGSAFVRGQSSTFVPVPGTEWAERFNGPANHNDRRPVMAVDSQGNVYVAAETKSLSPAPAYGIEDVNTDIVTIKYDRNGAQLWASTFNGQGQYIDSPKDIAVDASGNVFVTGYSWGGRESQGGTNYDFVTIKYNAGGARQWVRYHNGTQSRIPQDQAFALDLDQAGNVYVTGGSFYNGVYDGLVMRFATVKYDTQGNQLWVRHFEGEDRAGAMPNDVRVDAAGNVFVGGIFNYLDATTNTFASDFVLLKYDPAGTLLGQARYDTPGPNTDDEDRAVRMQLDAQGNVYILGVSFPNLGEEVSTRMDSVLLKFSNDCRFIWGSVYTRPGETEEAGWGLVVDSAGNVYVAGVTDDKNFFVAWLTLKYDAGGRLLWDRVLDLTPDDADHAIGVVLDPREDRIHVGGVAIIEPGGLHYDYTVVTYLADGTRQPVRSYGNPEQSDDALAQIAIDAAGNIYLAGAMRTAPGATSLFDLLTMKVGAPDVPSVLQHAISGKVSVGTAALSGCRLTLTSNAAGFTPRTVTTASDGGYSFTGLPAGHAYTVAPAASNAYSFAPASRSYSSLTSDQTGQNFAAAYKTYSVSGSILQGGAGLGGIRVTLSSTTAGFTPRAVTSTSTGAYTFTGVPAGRTYVITPSSKIYNFTPASRTLSNFSSNQAGQNFSVASRKSYSIGGRVTKSGTTTGIGGVTMRLTDSATGAVVKTVTTQADGRYSLTGVPAGYNYVLRPSKTGVSFSPTTRTYTNLSANSTGQNFTGG
ncbi:MAG TPA: SBBP repeat-containing protein [Pyrinomonadaceae bacterium]|nr:SBBP repeat-containing protein [Pyrinomonadaceae bacterium]